MTKLGNPQSITAMKSLIVISFISSLAVATGAAPPMRDAATHEQIVLAYRQASQQDPMRKQPPAKGPDPSTASPPRSLIGASDVICFNGIVTLVPKRAILQMPKNLADRLKYQLGSKVLSWADFYALNRGWITTIEVSRAQAEGNSPLPEETTRKIVKSGNLVVATYQAGPISVLPLKAAPAEPATGTPVKSVNESPVKTANQTPKS